VAIKRTYSATTWHWTVVIPTRVSVLIVLLMDFHSRIFSVAVLGGTTACGMGVGRIWCAVTLQPWILLPVCTSWEAKIVWFHCRGSSPVVCVLTRGPASSNSHCRWQHDETRPSRCVESAVWMESATMGDSLCESWAVWTVRHQPNYYTLPGYRAICSRPWKRRGGWAAAPIYLSSKHSKRVQFLYIRPSATVLSRCESNSRRQQCRFPGLAISNARVLIYFFQIKIIRKQLYQTAPGNCYGLKLPKYWLRFKNKFLCHLF